MSGGFDRLVRVFVAPAHDDAPTAARSREVGGRTAKGSRAPLAIGASLLRRRPRAEEPLLTRFVPPLVADPARCEESELRGRAAQEAVPGVEACVVVLCRPADAVALSVAAALVLLRGSPARSGLVCVWPASAISSRRLSAPARPAARRLQEALAARDLEARAAGPLALALLPADPGAAALAARRAAAVARGPVVHVLAGARPSTLTPLLHDADRVLVVGAAADPVCAVALAGLADEGLAARLVPAPEPGAARALAAAGLGVPQAARAALEAALEGLV
jgi:hypothetical protein